MNTKLRSLIFGYGLAILSTGSPTDLRLLVLRHLGNELPFWTCFPADFVTALYGRFGPTLVAVALYDLAAAQLCIPPADALLPESGVDWTGLALFSGFSRMT